MAEDSCVLDYLEHSFRSIHKVNVLVSGGAVDMNGALCSNILNHELQSTHDFLMLNLEKLYVKDIVDDKRRVALLQLYAVVKRAESLVQQCCESETSTWPERALSLHSIKDHVLDIVLHLRWWTSVLDLVIDSVMSKQPNSPNMQHVEIKRLQLANEEFEETLKVMALFSIMGSSSAGRVRRARLNDRKPTLLEITEQHGPTRFTGEQLGTKEHLDFILSYNFTGSENIMRPSRRLQAQRFDSNTFREVLTRCIDLQNAALEDRNDLLTKTAKLKESKEPGHLLATQVHSLLTDVKVDGIPDLDEVHHESDIAKGVSRVTWCGRLCVLKQIFNDPEDQTEAKSLKRFSHPHFVKFYRHFVATGDEDRPQSHILMEPMPMDLAEHMRKVKESPSSSAVPFSEPVAVDVMVQMAQAMWHMHSNYVVHRDLKPGNVLVRKVSPEEVPELFAEGYVVVKLGDYGLVREQTVSQYRAPEFATQGVKNAVQLKLPFKADLWSFGVVSLEVLSGEVPVFGDESSPLQGEIQKGARPRIPEGCPDYLRLCIESCWKSEPLERPGFSEVWRMLRIAKLRSLGLINHNYNWFMFQPERSEHVPSTTIRLEHQPRSGHVHLILPESSSSTSLATRPSRTKKQAKGNFSFLMSIFLKFSKPPPPNFFQFQHLVKFYIKVCRSSMIFIFILFLFLLGYWEHVYGD
jgi:serine/threonine protein kinase